MHVWVHARENREWRDRLHSQGRLLQRRIGGFSIRSVWVRVVISFPVQKESRVGHLTTQSQEGCKMCIKVPTQVLSE